MIYAFVFRLLLHRYTHGQRVAFATPVTTRSHPATAEMIGYFLNPLVVATPLDEQQQVGTCVEHFCAELKALLAHASLPFDVLAAALSPARQADRHPIFQVMFVYQESDPAPSLGDVALEPITLDLGAAKFDLTLLVSEGDGGLQLAVEFRADRFDAVWMEALLDHYEALLEHLPADRDRPVREVPMLDAAEAQRVSAWERGPRLDDPAMDLLPPQVLAQARRLPQGPAVTCAGDSLRYDELESAGRTIAAALRAEGVRPGDRVALFLPRSTQMIAGVVGSHLAGGRVRADGPHLPGRAEPGPARRRGCGGRAHHVCARQPPAGRTVAIHCGRYAPARRRCPPRRCPTSHRSRWPTFSTRRVRPAARRVSSSLTNT